MIKLLSNDPNQTKTPKHEKLPKGETMKHVSCQSKVFIITQDHVKLLIFYGWTAADSLLEQLKTKVLVFFLSEFTSARWVGPLGSWCVVIKFVFYRWLKASDELWAVSCWHGMKHLVLPRSFLFTFSSCSNMFETHTVYLKVQCLVSFWSCDKSVIIWSTCYRCLNQECWMLETSPTCFHASAVLTELKWGEMTDVKEAWIKQKQWFWVWGDLKRLIVGFILDDRNGEIFENKTHVLFLPMMVCEQSKNIDIQYQMLR